MITTITNQTLFGKAIQFVEDGNMNWEKLQASPVELLRVYNRAKFHDNPAWQSVESPLKKQASLLVGYHFVKFSNHFEVTSEDLQKNIELFDKELSEDPHNERLCKQARKISGWVSDSEAASIFKMTLTSSDNKEVTIDRFLWASKANSWRRWILTPNSWDNRPVPQSEEVLQALNHYMTEHALPESLSLPDLINLYDFAQMQFDKELKQLCINAIHNQTTGIELSLDGQEELIVHLSDANEASTLILQKLRAHMGSVILTSLHVMPQLLDQILYLIEVLVPHKKHFDTFNTT